MQYKKKERIFKEVYVNGKTIKVNKRGISIQLPEIVDGKLNGKVIVK